LMSRCNSGYLTMNSAGMMQILATCGIENVVSAPRVIQQFVADLDHLITWSDSNRGRSCCRLARGCARVHRDSDVGLRERGASFVPSPIIATSLPCSALRESGAAWFPECLGQKVIDPRFLRDPRRERVVAGNHDGA